MRKFGKTQQKILLVLAGGAALGFSQNPKQYFKSLKKIQREWQKIDQRNFSRSIKRLSQEKLVEEKFLKDGSFKLVLTKEGKEQSRKISLLGNSISLKKPPKWDGKWRLVIFDIPERDRIFRDILREHLYALGFYKLQHSVFVSPHPFEKAILELTALYAAEKYVRVITAERIDNEKRLKKHFTGI